MTDYLAAVRLFSRDIRYFLLSVALNGFAFFGIYALLFNLYLLRLGYDTAFIGLVNAVGPLALAFGSLPSGVLSRRIGSRRALLSGYLLMGVTVLLLPLGEGFVQPWAGRWILLNYALTWLLASVAVVNFSPFLMAHTTPRERQYAFSIQSALFPVSGFAGNLLGGILPGLLALLLGLTLDDAAPYRYALMLAGVVYILAAGVMLQTSPAKTPVATATTTDETPRRTPMPVVFISVIAGVWLLRVASEWAMRVFFNVYLDTELGASTALIGLLLAAGQLLGLAALFSPFVAARFGPTRTIVGAMIGMALAFLPLILISQSLAVGAGFILMIALVSVSTPIYTQLSQEGVTEEWRTVSASALTTCLGLGIALSAIAGGIIVTRVGFDALFVGGALLALIGAGIFGVYFRPPRGDLEKAVEPVTEPPVESAL